MRLSRRSPRRLALAGVALALLVGGGMVAAGGLGGPVGDVVAEAPQAERNPPVVGVMGTIPLYWGEAEGVADILNGAAHPHWARAVLEQRFRLVPLATLDAASLAPLRLLLLAQPRALTPQENVALDDWVRGGGHLLVFADPLLTSESRFSLGDRRRPQDVILLSPILRRWGLELQFAEDQPAGTTLREIAGQPVPVNLPGQFAPLMQGDCALEADGLLADCKIGRGTVVAMADAALLDLHHPAPEAAAALEMLVARGLQQGEPEGSPRALPGGAARVADSPDGVLQAASGREFFRNLAATAHNPP